MRNTTTGAIRIGIGGWTYEPWRGAFYPKDLTQKRELEYASRQLTSIEINGTYYGPQKPATFARWREETPADFVFAVKAPRYAMNRKVLAEAGATIERFIGGGLLELGDKLGPINWQCEPTKHFEPADFEEFLKLLPSKADGRTLRHVVEVRHPSFWTTQFIELLRAHGVAAVMAGDSMHPQIADVTAPFVYARIMGTSEKEKTGYSSEALNRWSKRTQAWAQGKIPNDLAYVETSTSDGKPRDVYLYVIGGHKVHNPAAAMSLLRMLD
jgi:uncharacterized protein YecE (DUF72 family)